MKRLPLLSALLAFLVGCMAFSTATAQTATDANEGSRLTHGSALGSYGFSWWGQPGRTYFIQHSDNLLAWEYLPLIYSGANGPLSRSSPSTPACSFSACATPISRPATLSMTTSTATR